MKEIFNISFQGPYGSRDFEFLVLTELFARIPEMADHDPNLSHRIHFFALFIVTKGTGKHTIFKGISFKNRSIKEGYGKVQSKIRSIRTRVAKIKIIKQFLT
ncbi:hypothetical protein [Maribacter sedimenticola]|uniref:hypothetical protein n=1 Tax=Maribacter sedimenticola TaxID=228956 RepID=UPI000B771087|nr:hypothetical protein [Maribacter sedimenticola]